MNRHMEEKLKSREAEILRLRDSTRNLQKGLSNSYNNLSSKSNSRRHSTRASTEDFNADSEELKRILDDKEDELSVRKNFDEKLIKLSRDHVSRCLE